MDTDPSMTYVEGNTDPVAGDIEFDHVTFTYPGDDKPTLKDVSFKVNAGEMIGIVPQVLVKRLWHNSSLVCMILMKGSSKLAE